MSKITEKESLDCGRMHIWALKAQKLPEPLCWPWTPPQIARFTHVTLLCFVSNFQSRSWGPPWPNPGSAPESLLKSIESAPKFEMNHRSCRKESLLGLDITGKWICIGPWVGDNWLKSEAFQLDRVTGKMFRRMNDQSMSVLLLLPAQWPLIYLTFAIKAQTFEQDRRGISILSNNNTFPISVCSVKQWAHFITRRRL